MRSALSSLSTRSGSTSPEASPHVRPSGVGRGVSEETWPTVAGSYVTGEKLEHVVDSLESRQVEYARVQDRFPYGLISSRAILTRSQADVSSTKQTLDSQLFASFSPPIGGSLHTYVRLNRPLAPEISRRTKFVRLYPPFPTRFNS